MNKIAGFVRQRYVVKQAITGEKLDAILAALKEGMSKAAVCRNFNVKRTTLIETLARRAYPSEQI